MNSVNAQNYITVDLAHRAGRSRRTCRAKRYET